MSAISVICHVYIEFHFYVQFHDFVHNSVTVDITGPYLSF